ncbi:MAG TPA: hypothetical protein VF545_05215 [Thermoleophilaceae bacterium]|jgi:hypothetical protein
MDPDDDIRATARQLIEREAEVVRTGSITASDLEHQMERAMAVIETVEKLGILSSAEIQRCRSTISHDARVVNVQKTGALGVAASAETTQALLHPRGIVDLTGRRLGSTLDLISMETYAEGFLVRWIARDLDPTFSRSQLDLSATDDLGTTYRVVGGSASALQGRKDWRGETVCVPAISSAASQIRLDAAGTELTVPL